MSQLRLPLRPLAPSLLPAAALLVLAAALIFLSSPVGVQAQWSCSQECTYNNLVSTTCVNNCNVCLLNQPYNCWTYFDAYFSSSNGAYTGANCSYGCPWPWWAWLLLSIGILIVVVAVFFGVRAFLQSRRG